MKRELDRDLDEALRLLRLLIERNEIIMALLDQLTQDVADTVAGDQSIITLLNGIQDKLNAALAAASGGDPALQAAVAALSTQLEASHAAVVAAVANPGTQPTPATTP